MNAAFTSYEESAGPGEAVTGGHKRICNTTGTVSEPVRRAYRALLRQRRGGRRGYRLLAPRLAEPPEPLWSAAAERSIRWISYDRPGYLASTSRPGRDVASASADAASVADALGVAEFAVMGHSGGGPHALACAAVSRPWTGW
jgi:pimeloyl-ACP methyl ester carboxylesterase